MEAPLRRLMENGSASAVVAPTASAVVAPAVVVTLSGVVDLVSAVVVR